MPALVHQGLLAEHSPEKGRVRLRVEQAAGREGTVFLTVSGIAFQAAAHLVAWHPWRVAVLWVL